MQSNSIPIKIQPIIMTQKWRIKNGMWGNCVCFNTPYCQWITVIIRQKMPLYTVIQPLNLDYIDAHKSETKHTTLLKRYNGSLIIKPTLCIPDLITWTSCTSHGTRSTSKTIRGELVETDTIKEVNSLNTIKSPYLLSHNQHWTANPKEKRQTLQKNQQKSTIIYNFNRIYNTDCISSLLV